jgi:hypothetical protein
MKKRTENNRLESSSIVRATGNFFLNLLIALVWIFMSLIKLITGPFKSGKR